jgi:catechol 2,3-dioxygenase
MAEAIHPDTFVGAVRLDTPNIARMKSFYEDAIGLEDLGRSDGIVRLGIDAKPLVELVDDPNALPKPYGTTGLFHLAILVPSRADLARAIRRVVGADWTFTGASDHLVSEAMYLDDPDGNGIEIYRDRPRADWERTNGELKMASLPLDIDSILAEEEGEPAPKMAPGTRMGHVHLQVSDLAEIEDFYSGVLGFEVTVRGYPGALFVSAGGYHHHLGFNTWAGAGAPAPPEGSRGLDRFEVTLPDRDELALIEQRLEDSGTDYESTDGGLTTVDPSSNRLILRPPASTSK